MVPQQEWAHQEHLEACFPNTGCHIPPPPTFPTLEAWGKVGGPEDRISNKFLVVLKGCFQLRSRKTLGEVNARASALEARSLTPCPHPHSRGARACVLPEQSVHTASRGPV